MKNPGNWFLLLVAVFLLPLITGCHITRNTYVTGDSKDPEIISVTIKNNPLFVNRACDDVIYATVSYAGHKRNRELTGIELSFSEKCHFKDICEIKVFCGPDGGDQSLFGQTGFAAQKVDIEGVYRLFTGINRISVTIRIDSLADIAGHLRLEDIRLIFDDKQVMPVSDISYPVLRFATVVRAAGQDNCDTYRIPGIITTKSGTLVAVFDNRYNGSKDLQEDIDIGMSRSTDGGQSWEHMKVIMDMDEYGDHSEELNGIGDPCILYDNINNTIWVAALWMSGSSTDKMIWWDSQPGIAPEETGQFMVVKSTDDGLTWSKPVNITGQIKQSAWQLLFQGPGRGITMKDGTLVFPAQFKADLGVKALDGGQFTCHSTIVYSKDAGRTWQLGTGAKPNTTEAQVVELNEGVLMLNMRDDRNRSDKSSANGRAVAITNDLGHTWETHPSSNSLLPEPNCMASLISAVISLGDTEREVLFFSNPNHKTERKNMTVKASLDNGLTWPSDLQVEFYQDVVYGYSCLTMVDKNTLGILYEGNKEIFFQQIPVSDILRGLH